MFNKLKDFAKENLNINNLKDKIKMPENNSSKYLKEVFIDIENEDGNLQEKIYEKIVKFLDENNEENEDKNEFLNNIILNAQKPQNIILELSNFMNKNDIELLKKIHISKEYKELEKLKFNSINQVDKIKEQIVKNKVFILNYKTLYELFGYMEEYIEQNEDNLRDNAFIYSLRKIVLNGTYYSFFFDILNRIENHDFLNIVLEEIIIFPEDIYNIFVENETIVRGSRFYLIREFCSDKIKESKEKLLD